MAVKSFSGGPYIVQDTGTGKGTGWYKANGTAVIDENGNVGSVDLSVPGQTQGDILYFNGTSWTRLGAGATGYFLQTNGPGTNPVWAAGTTGPTGYTGPQGPTGPTGYTGYTGAHA